MRSPLFLLSSVSSRSSSSLLRIPHAQGRSGKRPEVYLDGWGPGADGLGQLHGVAYRLCWGFFSGRAAGESDSGLTAHVLAVADKHTLFITCFFLFFCGDTCVVHDPR